jgi:hypothetical protein
MTEREERERGRVVRVTTFNEEGGNELTAMKVPMQCPLVILVKAG